MLTIKCRNVFRRAAPTYLDGIDQHSGAVVTVAKLTAIKNGLNKGITHAAGRSPA